MVAEFAWWFSGFLILGLRGTLIGWIFEVGLPVIVVWVASIWICAFSGSVAV